MEEYYTEYYRSPNVPEICRAAGRPSDIHEGVVPRERKQAALSVVKERNLTCNWSQEIKDWREYAASLNQSSAAAAVPENQITAVLLREEWMTPDMKRCVYNDGSTRTRVMGMKCPAIK